MEFVKSFVGDDKTFVASDEAMRGALTVVTLVEPNGRRRLADLGKSKMPPLLLF